MHNFEIQTTYLLRIEKIKKVIKSESKTLPLKIHKKQCFKMTNLISSIFLENAKS